MSFYSKSIDKIFLWSTLLIICVTFLAYLPSLNIPFFSDETSFIQRNEVHSINQTIGLLNKKDYDGDYYRPIPNLISGLSTLVFGYNSILYRIMNILIHALNAVLVYLFCFNLLGKTENKNTISIFSALFFALFPLHDYAVIWQTDLFDRIMLLFYLIALISFIRNKYRPNFTSIFFFLISLMSKEMAFSFPLVIAALTYFFYEEAFSIKKSFYNCLPYLGVAVLFIIARIILFNNNIFEAHDSHSYAGLFDVFKNYFLFSGLLIFPFYIREIQSFIFAHKIISILLIISFGSIAGYGFIRYKRKDKFILFSILFVLLTIAPASRLLMRWYLYLPSVGFTIFLSYIIFSSKFLKNKRPIFISLIVLFIYGTTLVSKEIIWEKVTNQAVISLQVFLQENRNEIINSGEITLLTIPGKIDDIPVFQLAFDKLFNYYFNSSKHINVNVESRSYLNSFNDSITVTETKTDLILTQEHDNYFILFNNKKNIKFGSHDYLQGKLKSFELNKSEVRNKVLFTFSNGKFYKLEGAEK